MRRDAIQDRHIAYATRDAIQYQHMARAYADEAIMARALGELTTACEHQALARHYAILAMAYRSLLQGVNMGEEHD